MDFNYLSHQNRNELFSKYQVSNELGVISEVKRAIDYSPTYRDNLIAKLAVLQRDLPSILKIVKRKYLGRIN